MTKKINTKQMTEQEWLGHRKNSIGGSDAAALLGKSKYNNPLDVYMSKVGNGKAFNGNKHTRYGHLMEPIIADVFEEESGCKLRRCYDMIIDGDFDHIHGNIDRKIIKSGPENSTGILECKATIDTDWVYDINPQWYIQLQHYLMIFKYDYGYISWESDRDFNFMRFESDPELHEFLQEEYYNFWKNNVIPKVPPEGPFGDVDKVMKPIEGDICRIEDDDIFDLYLNLMETRKERLALKKKEGQLKDSLELIMGDAEKLAYGDDLIATQSYNERYYPKRVDELREKHPDIFEKYFTLSKFTRTNYRKPKKI